MQPNTLEQALKLKKKSIAHGKENATCENEGLRGSIGIAMSERGSAQKRFS